GRNLFETGDLGDHYPISIGGGVHKLRLENVPASGVRAWLEHRQDLLAWKFYPQGPQGLPDGRGMMAEVIYDDDAAADAAHFHPALDPFEGVEGGLDLGIFQATMFGAGYNCQRVADIEFTDKVE